MHDIKDICQRILDEPAPPRRTGVETLTIARRDTRRRSRRTVAGGALAVLAVATSAVLLAPPDPQSAIVPAVPPPAPSTISADTVAPVPSMPSGRSLQAHGTQIARRMVEALPADFVAVPEFAPGTENATTTWAIAGSGRDAYVSFTLVVVNAGERKGLVWAVMVRDNQPSPADRCDDTTAQRLGRYHRTSTTNCRTITVGGTPVRVTSDERDHGQTITATRFLTNGFVTIRVDQRVPEYATTFLPEDAPRIWAVEHTGPHPALSALPLSSLQLAQLAVDPVLLP